MNLKTSKFTGKIRAALPAVATLATAAIIAFGFNAGVSEQATAKGKQIEMNPIVEFDTNKGVIKAIIYKRQAPLTSANFLDLVNRNFYNGLTFHRYEPGFCIQGGDPEGTGTGNFIDPVTHKIRYLKLEKKAELTHDSAGMLAMARTNDPDTASCQFYFTLAPATFLDNPPGYAVFGKVIEGLDVVMSLRKGDKMTRVVELPAK
ncbi:MAG: peptidylprolyl isomerase [Cyanobacteria bacterium REEB67]|nr:peptidylprolyl isomerase [Cyanobacteria bacterium REEB67]